MDFADRHDWVGEQVRCCRYRLPPSGDLGYSGARGAVGLGYRSTVYKRTLPPAPSRVVLFVILKGKSVEIQSKQQQTLLTVFK
jgi:hypothetical protein